MMSIPQYLSKSKKSQELKKIINEALYILSCLGIPLEAQTQRRLERLGMAFLAVANVKNEKDWIKIPEIYRFHALRTRDIIHYWNENFSENISDSSYDDIRRKDLKLLVLSEIVIPSAANPNAARNDGTRAFALNPEYVEIISQFGQKNWTVTVRNFLKNRTTLEDKLSEQRNLNLIPVTFPSGKQVTFSPGKHNELQKEIIEQFLPRYGYGAEVLYVGDTSDKFLHLERERLQELKFFELSHGKLPDIVAYSSEKNWLYLIEAVYSSGAISSIRLLELKELTSECTADIIFVTAFPDRAVFRKFVAIIAWETEVWIAESPDHVIHFDGDKFLGSYSEGIESGSYF